MYNILVKSRDLYIIVFMKILILALPVGSGHVKAAKAISHALTKIDPDVQIRYENSFPGFFEMDSVCYGTTKQQGRIVFIVIDSTENPGWPSQGWYPDIYGDVDTIILYIND
ncbi:hypothetical protein ES703_72321 [subsurface metagenome]